MSTKTTEFGARTAAPAGTQAAAPGATAGNANLSQGFDAFLRTYAEGGIHRKAAEAAGLTIAEIAAKLEADEDFADRYKLARRTRRLIIEDALMTEAIGEVVTDAVSGKTKLVRNVDVLKRLAVREDIIDPERPATQIAVQQNNGQSAAAASPEVQAFAKRNEERLRALLKRKPAAITVEATPVDPDSDII
jgi:hypothetical protein